MRNLKITLMVLASVCLVVSCWMVVELALLWRTAREVAEELPAEVGMQIDETRESLLEEIRAGRIEATEAIGRLSAQTVRVMDKAQAGMLQETRRLRADMVTQSTLWRTETSRQADRFNDSIAAVSKNTEPVLDSAYLLETEAMRTIRLLTPQLLGAMAAIKVAGGNTAQITRDLKPAAPVAAKAVQNVEKITRPLSLPAKIGRTVFNVVKKLWIF